MPVRAWLAALVLTTGCPRDGASQPTSEPRPAQSGSNAVVLPSAQPKCRSDADCPPAHSCVCEDSVCSVKTYTVEDPDEPFRFFCVPLQRSDATLPPELRGLRDAQ